MSTRGGSAGHEGRFAAAGEEVVVCVDLGSTFTKAALVALPEGRLLATAEHPTTLDGDVMDGVDRCVAALSERDPRAADAELLGCSSAGGGLRVAVVGNEALVTAEAGRRVALSSGGRVVHVATGEVDRAALAAAAPDVVLLVGGTDGGNAEPLLRCARALAGTALPVVVAGNAAAAGDAAALLAAAGTPHEVAANVVPRIGVLAPEPARAAIRAAFLRHVIGGKHLSARADLATVVRSATPDAVLAAVQLLARGAGEARPGAGDVAVVDVGGATTDVYSVVEPPEDGPDGLSREVVATTAAGRTVEADLGVRWSAIPTVEAAEEAGLPVAPATRAAAEVRRDDPAYLPRGPQDAAADAELAGLALAVALRRHAGRAQVRFDPAGGGRLLERSGTDLREVGLVVVSGGVLRHGAPVDVRAGLRADGGWQLPRDPRVVVDADYVLAPAGLLAERHPAAAYRLLRGLLAATDAGQVTTAPPLGTFAP